MRFARLSKGQMFVLTMIFLMGMVFVVQQVLFTYSSVDLVAGLEKDDYYFMKGLREAAEQTVITTSDCANVSRNLNEFEGFFRSQVMESGFVVSADHELECGNWDNLPPDPPPVVITLYVKGKGFDSSTTLDLYHRVS
jgi:hypothetical protein